MHSEKRNSNIFEIQRFHTTTIHRMKETDLLRLDKTLLLLLSVAAGNAESLASNIRLLFPSLLTDSDLRKSSGSKCSNFAWKSGRGDDICLLSTTASVGIEDKCILQSFGLMLYCWLPLLLFIYNLYTVQIPGSLDPLLFKYLYKII
ncbi:hypothetical protein GQX74_015271 [Glossina fuscipes]|nr:hypothetical protein GQX74_015271 [Glossina fuscipes]